MTIDEFNRLDPASAAEVLATCADIEDWVASLVSRRPYSSRQALLDAAGEAAQDWSSSAVDGALAHHPRIAERPDAARLGSANAAHSTREQSGLAGMDDATQTAILAGNAAYEERFGRVFLIRAAGRTPQEILTELTRRLDNDEATEDGTVARELAEIALLRLGQAVAA
ncbi:MAG: 2-oxo-4-hydroxy-4-carboxy-5-ureidoimidazoline decarboxylase [Microlunatus sp.]